MNLSDYSFHDSTILEVKEMSSEQAIEYLINFPVNWKENIFEHYVLKFKGVLFYLVDEIPFVGEPTILDIEASKETDTVRKIAIITNAGRREIHYSSIELDKAKEKTDL